MWKKMAKNEYMFDKRKRKRSFIKYLIIFGIAFIPVVAFNVAVNKYLDNWLVIFLDCVIILIFAVIGNILAKKIFDKKDAKLRAKIKAREEMEARKKQILEDSYKQKREAKKQKKIEEILEPSDKSEPKKKK